MKTDSSSEDINSLKKSIRSVIQKTRDDLSCSSRREKSIIICHKFINLGYYENSSSILAYYPFRSEIDTRIIIRDALSRGKKIALPRVGKNGLDLFYINDLSKDLESGSYDIMEPIPARCRAAAFDEMELVLVPGVGFDKNLNRLGYGGGFYDRLLSEIPENVPRIALAFSLQILDEIPVSGHDLKVDMLITESSDYCI